MTGAIARNPLYPMLYFPGGVLPPEAVV